MKRNISETITFIKKYLLQKYNYFVIDINDSFIGCKFHNDNYYIFYISSKEETIGLNYRLDINAKDKITISIEDVDDSTLAILIDNIISNIISKNNQSNNKRRILANSLVNYNYQNNQEESTVESNNIDADNNEQLKQYLDTPLIRIKMSRRLKNGLLRNNIKTLRDFIEINFEQMKKFRNLGETSFREADLLLKELKSNPEQYIIKSEDGDAWDDSDYDFNCDDKLELSEEFIDKLYSEISIDSCKLSVRLTNCLKRSGIKTVADFIRSSKENLKTMDSLGKKTYNEAICFKKKIYDENSFGDDNSDYIFRVIKVLAESEEISLIMLKNFLSTNTNYPIDKLLEDVNILRNKGLVEFTMNGIKIRKKTVIEIINGFDLPNQKILLERLSGKTLKEIGDSMGLTRERIRQKFEKLFKKIINVDEDKYKELFEEYNITESDFTKIFNVDKTTYYYLKEKYKTGEKNIEDALLDDRFNEHQKDIIRGLRNITKIYGQTIIINKQNLIGILVQQYAKQKITIEEFKKIYNNFVKENPNYNLTESDERALEAALSRLNNVVFSLGRNFRYYNINEIPQQDYEELKEIIMNLEAGYYSMLVIYQNNKELINSLDIRDEYELHNLCKNLFGDIEMISFDRMPNFSIKGKTKNEFTLEKIKELSPISLNDFTEIMEQEYGHKQSTFLSYLTGEFKDYIDNGIIKGNVDPLSDDEIEKIKSILVNSFYNIDELKEILVLNGFNNIDDIISSVNMYKIGYRIRSSYIVKKEIGSIEEYLKNMALQNDFIMKNNFLNNSTYLSMIKRVEKNLDIFLISSDEYITIRKLNSLGVTKEDIVHFCEKVKNKFSEINYFTLANVREIIEIEKLDDFGFDDIFLENIIGNIENITYIKFSNNKIFSFAYKSFDSKQFVLDSIGSRISIFVDELQNELMNKYEIEVNQERIKNAIIDTDLYYSDELSKIYQNKDYYYEEVFNYE